MWSLLETGTSCHSRVTEFTPGIWCGPCWRQGLLVIQGQLGSLQIFGVVLVGDRDFLPFKGDWVHSRFLVWFLLETGTSCHSRVTGFTPGFWCGPCWRQGLLAIRGRLGSLQIFGVVLVGDRDFIQGRLGSLQVFGVVLVGDRDFLPFKGDWVHWVHRDSR